MNVSNRYRLCVIYNSWWSWERLVRNKWCWNNGDQNKFRHAFCEFFCVLCCLYTSVERLFDFCFVFSYFSSIKCFLLCDLSKNFKVHCNAFEKSLGHLTLSSWKNHMLRNDRHLLQNVCCLLSLLRDVCTKSLQMFYVSQIVVHLSERNGLHFLLEKNCLWNSKNNKIIF